ncbi:nSTAND1 domain-containing NTPase [Nocardioides xinjiangensis]|uniref:nSTAND1 domain-containing NTPase n=1 Tax=Nocardioides xinjiangensis TaxID=2817376 RepID=UPI001B317B47|nr:BTAD domain-containing putative transcriptional regulator [Nocardioides sp. SYSU D00778]
MEFEVLGPVRVAGDDGPVELRGAKERTLLGHLVAHVGRTVPVTDLVDSLWGEDPPRTAAKSLQTYVLRVRQALDPLRTAAASVIVTDPGGYRLAVPADSVDAHRFARLAALGHAALEEGRYASCSSILREALDLWRGPAYHGLEDTPYGAAESRRLEELRVAVLEDLWRAELEVGHEAAAVPELERLLEEHPYRERLWTLLVLALYRSGRQGDALAAVERCRTLLGDDLGVEPGEEMRALQGRVLRQDPDLRRTRPAVPDALVPPRSGLVGRDAEQRMLEDAWLRAAAGEAVTVVVRGPSGAGATRLAMALASVVARDGRPVALADGPDAVPPTGGLLVAEHPVRPAGPGTMVLRLDRPGAELPAAGLGLDLTPLDEPAVRALVAPYVATADLDEATRFVLGAGPAWPGAVHDAAAGWARDTARARVAAGAGRLDLAVDQLGRARAEVVEGMVALGTAAARVPRSRAECPWRGLSAYDVQDAEWFAGRERLVAELLARTASGRLVAVVGASGSGKSSLVRAGLLAGLAAGRLPASETWRAMVMRPGHHPVQELATSALGTAARAPDAGDLLARLLEDETVADRSVLVVDQLEEAWTLCTDADERARFLDLLADLVCDESAAVSVVVALRADFVGHLAEHPRLAQSLSDDTVLVGSPSHAEVARAIHLPAAAAGLELEVGLADAIVSDAGDEPGLLPLLSVALAQLWQAREGHRLTLAAYVGMGGLAGSIVHLAEQAFLGLSEAEQQTTRTVLLRLTGPGTAGSVVRRRVPEPELAALPGAAAVIDRLTDARLLTRAGGHVEVAHESLFREWPRLTGWIREDEATRDARRRLADAAAEWDADGRDPGSLWRGVRLESALEATRAEPLTATEQSFLDAAVAALRAETAAAEERARSAVRQNRRLRGTLVGLVVLLLVALVAGLLALRAREEAQAATGRAEASAIAADAKRLAAQALNEDFLDTALLEAVEAVRVEQSPETYGALLTLLARTPRLVRMVRTPRARFLQAATSPDGRRVFLADQRQVLAFDAERGTELWRTTFSLDGEAGQPGAIASGPAGLLVPVGTPSSGMLTLLDPRTGDEQWRLRSSDVPWQRLQGPPAGEPRLLGFEAVFLPDGRIATTAADKLLLLRPDGSLDGSRHIGTFSDFLQPWPDGRVSLAVDPGVGAILDPDRPAPRRPLPHLPIAVAPAGDRLVTARETPTGYFLQLRDLEFRPVGGEIVMPSFVQRVVWSPDGSRFAVALDEEVQVREARRGQLVATLDGAHSGATIDATFAAGSNLLWVAGREGLGTSWDLPQVRGVTTEQPVRVEPHLAGPSAGRLTAYVRVNSFDRNGAAVADLAEGRDVVGELDQVEGCPCQVGSVTTTPDDSAVVGAVHEWKPDFSAIHEDRGKLAFWSARDGALEGTLDLPWHPRWVDMTPDGRYAVVNGSLGWAAVDMEDRRLVGTVTAEPLGSGAEPVGQVRVSPDGREAALVRNGEVVVVDPTTGEELRRAEIEDPGAGSGDGSEGDQLDLTSVTWTPDQDVLVLGSFEGSLHFVDAMSLDRVAPPRLEIDGWVLQAEVSPDGRWLATMGTDGDVLLWDTATWAPLGNAVIEDGSWGVLEFAEDSRSLTAWFEQLEQDRRGVAHTVSLDPADWVARACSLAGRQLTQDEWAVIHPDREWRSTCR